MAAPKTSPPQPMARQLARLLAGSNLDELDEVVRRWLHEAGGEAQRQRCQELGRRLLDMKRALAETRAEPTEAELELALSLMLNLAAQTRGGPLGMP